MDPYNPSYRSYCFPFITSTWAITAVIIPKRPNDFLFERLHRDHFLISLWSEGRSITAPPTGWLTPIQNNGAGFRNHPQYVATPEKIENIMKRQVSLKLFVLRIIDVIQKACITKKFSMMSILVFWGC